MSSGQAKVTVPSAPGFSVEALGYGVDRVSILKNLTMTVKPGAVTGLIGHNGSGKSTLVKLMARQLSPTAGKVLFEGQPVGSWSERAFARQVAYLPQDMPGTLGLTVRELVGFGRYPWHGALGRFGREDAAKVEAALEQCGLEALAGRQVDSLSGGERQRAWIAMTLAQDTRCLLLDEPISALDVAHQLEVLSLVRRLAHDRGMTVVLVLHDVNLAARFCDELHALKGGELVISGPPRHVMTPACLAEIYGVEMTVMEHPVLGTPVASAG
ncbi:ABC transporter ATP-binding protein [Fodinicurvata sediminis]|uniref:ABC transporter ATP-binding protein n=1 Tax=Fodinicurvata sediminis TaxID=1121832 RepID=UPI0003B45FAB|nr:ATP-binding cassette domain-containing protein [Fodinicurvata sediminis]